LDTKEISGGEKRVFVLSASLKEKIGTFPKICVEMNMVLLRFGLRPRTSSIEENVHQGAGGSAFKFGGFDLLNYVGYLTWV